MVSINKWNYVDVFNLKLKPIEKAIIDEILKHCNQKGFAFPSQNTIAQNVNLSRQTVCKYINKISKIQVYGLPFMKIFKTKGENNKYLKNVYYFPWYNQMEAYISEKNKAIIDILLKEYSQMAEEEFLEDYIDKSLSTNHVNGIDNNYNRESSYFYIEQIKDITNRLSTTLNLSKAKVVQVISNIGYELKEKNTRIFNLKKYLVKALQNASVNAKIEDVIKKMYYSFFHKEPEAVFYMDWEGLASML